MKRAKQMFAVLLCIAALCVLAPAALAAQPLDESENAGKVIIYFETCGGTGIPVVERTNADGKLSSLPTPIMEGYTFNGWFTDIVGATPSSRVRLCSPAKRPPSTRSGAPSTRCPPSRRLRPTPLRASWSAIRARF